MHIRLFDTVEHSRVVNSVCTLRVSGELAPYTGGAAYESYVAAVGGRGRVSLVSTDVSGAPPGTVVTFDPVLLRVYVRWPAYTTGVTYENNFPNLDFEDGGTAWSLGSGWSIQSNDVNDDPNTPGSEWAARFVKLEGSSDIETSAYLPCVPGTSYGASARVQQGASDASAVEAVVFLRYYDVNDQPVATSYGTPVVSGSNANWNTSVLSPTPAATNKVKLGVRGTRRRQNKALWIDNLAWSGSTLVEGEDQGTLGGEVYSVTVTLRDSGGCETTAVLPIIPSDVIVVPGNWQHLAITKIGSLFTLYVNGIPRGSREAPFLPNGGTGGNFIIGRYSASGAGSDYEGWIDEFRFTDALRWSTNFTPPTAAATSSNDPLWASNRFVLHFEGADNSFDFVDSMGNVSFGSGGGGSAFIDNGASRFGTTSLRVSAEGFISAGFADVGALSGTWTIDFWVRPDGPFTDSQYFFNAYQQPSIHAGYYASMTQEGEFFFSLGDNEWPGVGIVTVPEP